MDESQFSLRWQRFFLRLARENAIMSKDPSTQVGCVIARPDKTVAAMGFNGLPRFMDDSPRVLNNREEKYARILHAEVNAMLVSRERLVGYTMFVWPAPPCHRCMAQIAQAGIATVYFPAPTPDYMERWADSYQLALETAKMCNVLLFCTLVDIDG